MILFVLCLLMRQNFLFMLTNVYIHLFVCSFECLKFFTHNFLTPYTFQGDVLRNSLLARYFGKAFIQKHDTVELSSYQLSSVMHGPGGK